MTPNLLMLFGGVTAQFWDWIEKALPGGGVAMLGLAAICWATWKLRNMACLEKKNIKSPGEILFYACALMQYWTGLYPEGTQKMIATGVELMMKTCFDCLGSMVEVLR
jgi:hypothetical protein